MNWSGAERELDDRAAAIPKPPPSSGRASWKLLIARERM